MTAAPPAATVAAPQGLPSAAQLRALLARLGHGLLQRETAVHLALLAALAGEHVLLIGPPGTAKSALARRLHSAFDGAPYFERLLTRFSTPEELFGPLSLKALEEDRYERLVQGYLPTAGIAFLDEVFKAHSAILNALLTLLNEREFDNGTQRQRTPLVAVVAASNEVPSDASLHAFYDRFLLRVPIAPVGDEAFAALLALGDGDGDDSAERDRTATITPEQRDALAQAARGVSLGAEFVAACSALRQWLAQRKTPLSDRRWRQFVGLARTAAASEGRQQLDELDLWLAPFVASAHPSDVPALQTWFTQELLALPNANAPWLAQAVAALRVQFDQERDQERDGEDASPADAVDTADASNAGKLAVAQRLAGASVNAAADPESASPPSQTPRLLGAHQAASQARRWSPLHLQARLHQVQELRAQVVQAQQGLSQQLQALQTRLARRLWLPPLLCHSLCAPYTQALAQLHDFDQTLDELHLGFANLPATAPGQRL